MAFNTMKILNILCSLVLLVHFSIIAISILPDEYAVKKELKPLTKKYVIPPFFTQDWRMFAPPPPFNTSVLVQMESFKDGKNTFSNWLDIYSPLVTSRKGSPFFRSGEAGVAYFLFNCVNNIRVIGIQHFELGMASDSMRGDSTRAGKYAERRLRDTFTLEDKSIIAYTKHLIQKQPQLFITQAQPDSVFLHCRLIFDCFSNYTERFLKFEDINTHKVYYTQRPRFKLKIDNRTL
jgi:Family of unknown function (DUF5819)